MNFLKDPFYPQIPFDKYTKVTKKLREFFLDEKGFMEVHPQNRLAILSACENPHSIAKFNYDNLDYPLPQTGQMTLEDYLLLHPDQKGFFCVTTSYRNEKTPEVGRHAKIFPMAEFELLGGFDELIQLEIELLQFLGFDDVYPTEQYESVASKYGVQEIDSATELKISEDFGNVFLLTHFPEHTNPFWNMERNSDGTANKCDVLIHGMETIGSAERSCDKDKMYNTFFSIENGAYSEKLFSLFGFERVINELNEFLSHNFIVRSGGGIGLTRLVRGMEMSNLL
jgi:aspartyl/asparaginyl-tRNA synthetase